jgi:hypothetical protein
MSNKKLKGRPRFNLDEPLSESITIRLTERQLELLNLHCWRYDQSQGEIVRWCLDTLGVF